MSKLISKYQNTNKEEVKLIPKAQLGTLLKKGIAWIGNHMAPTQEQTMFQHWNNQRAKLQAKQQPVTKNEGIKSLQRELIKYGYLPKGEDDGYIGKKTNFAIQQAKNDGYKIENFKLIPPKKSNSSFLDRIQRFFSSKPQTYEEYVKSKQKEIREKAALINKSTATPTFPVGNFMVGHDFDFYGNTKDGEGSAKNMTQEQVRELFTKYKKQAQKYIDKHPNIPKESLSQIKNTMAYYDRVIKNPMTVATPGSGIGFGCIYSATHGYKQDGLNSSNQNVFANNIQLANDAMNNPNSSYELIPFNPLLDKPQVGDIIQIGRSGEGRRGPHHAVMVTGFNFMGDPKVTQTNADTAGIDDRGIDSYIDYEKVLLAALGDDKGLPGYQPQGLQIIRFKGSPSDREKWRREFNTKYH